MTAVRCRRFVLPVIAYCKCELSRRFQPDSCSRGGVVWISDFLATIFGLILVKPLQFYLATWFLIGLFLFEQSCRQPWEMHEKVILASNLPQHCRRVNSMLLCCCSCCCFQLLMLHLVPLPPPRLDKKKHLESSRDRFDSLFPKVRCALNFPHCPSARPSSNFA